MRCGNLVLKQPSSFLISHRFATKWYLHSTSNPFSRFVLPMTSHVDGPPCLKKSAKLLYLSCVLSACFDIAIRVTKFVHMHTCYLNISLGSYSRAATISFSTSGGAVTIHERRLIEQIRYAKSFSMKSSGQA